MFRCKLFYAFSGRSKLLVLFQQTLIGILSAGQESRGFFLELLRFQIVGKDMMRWIGLMNNIRTCADEIVLNDIVYS